MYKLVTEVKYTALHLTAEKGHVDVVKVLLQNGAKVNAVDERNRRRLTSRLYVTNPCTSTTLLWC